MVTELATTWTITVGSYYGSQLTTVASCLGPAAFLIRPIATEYGWSPHVRVSQLRPDSSPVGVERFWVHESSSVSVLSMAQTLMILRAVEYGLVFPCSVSLFQSTYLTEHSEDLLAGFEMGSGCDGRRRGRGDIKESG